MTTTPRLEAPVVTMNRPMLGEEELAAAARVLASGALAQGVEVAGFEDAFSAVVERRHCIAVNSGTSALHLALLANGVGPGDEVIVPSFTFAATANAVGLTGATPVFADIDPLTFCLDPDAAAAAVGPRTAAVMPVHLYGQPADMAALRTVGRRHGLLIVEDAAQAHAATFDGRPAGALGDAAAFSFYPTKNMTTGEGGMVVTADAAVATKVRLLRNQGMDRQYENELVGFNLRLTEVAAAIGRVQLRRLPGFTAVRRSHAETLDAAISATGAVERPHVLPGATHVYNQYTVRSRERDRVQQSLSLAAIESRVYYPTPVHLLPAFGQHDLDLPATASAAAEVLSLPVGPHLTDDEVARVAEALAQL